MQVAGRGLGGAELPHQPHEARERLQREPAARGADQVGALAPGHRAVAGQVERAAVATLDQQHESVHHVVLVHVLDLLVATPDVGEERLLGPRADDVVVHVGPEHDAGPNDRHRALGVPERPELAEPVALGLVARVLEVRDPAHRPVLGDRHRVVRERAVGGGRRGDQHLLGAGLRGRLEHVVRAAHVDVVHRVLVVHRVEHERQVDERVGLLAGQEVARARGVANVQALELDLRPEGARRADVRHHHALGVVALDQPLDQAAADVPRAPGHHVAHRAGCYRPGNGEGAREGPL